MKKILLFVVLAFTTAIGIAQVSKVVISDTIGWHPIGQTTVSFTRDKDEIKVPGSNRFTAIKFKVKDAPIILISLEIFYEGGGKQNVVLNMSIKKEGESSVINLNGGEHDLQKVVFMYRTLSNYTDENALVELWGLKTNTNKKDK